MLTVNAGPLAFPTSIVSLAISVLVAAGVGHWVGRRTHVGIGNVLFDMILAGMLAARLAFVFAWFEKYRLTPWSIIDIRDGGFTVWAGVIAALLVGSWQGCRHANLRKPLLLGLLAGAFTWSTAPGMFRIGDGPSLSSLAAAPLLSLAGGSASLSAISGGRPMVINLWATWCPPCRREMPVLAEAQRLRSDVSFVFANQGEGVNTIQQYLAAAKLLLSNVILDPSNALGHEAGSRGLPTTLFYDAQGHLVDAYVGALSTATLASKLKKIVSPVGGAH
jgi:thiol-disulfide isomerase/thioredoxin